MIGRLSPLFHSAPFANTYPAVIAQYVSQIPIAPIKPAQKASISKIVNQILAAKRTNPDADVSDLEKWIDQIVYLLYGLTDKEIKIVEDYADCADFLIRVIPESAIICDSDSEEIGIVEEITQPTGRLG